MFFKHAVSLVSAELAALARYLSHAFVDVEVELAAHIEADPVAVTGLVVDVHEGDLDRVGALRVERHPVRAAVLGVSEEFVDAFSSGELSFNFVHLLPSSLRRHLGNWRSSLSEPRMLATAHASQRRSAAAMRTERRRVM